MLGEWEGWLHSRCFAAQAIKEEKQNLSTCDLLGGVHLQDGVVPSRGWDGGSRETQAQRLSRLVHCLHSHRRDGDVNNLSLALFWGMI